MLNKSSLSFAPIKPDMVVGGYKFNIFVIFCLIVVNVLYKFEFSLSGVRVLPNLWSPGWLFFGPFVYFSNNCLKQPLKSVYNNWLHFLPGVAFTLFFCIANIGLELGQAWAVLFYDWYKSSVYVISISLIVYAVLVISDRTRDINNLEPKYELLLIISGFYIIIGIMSFMMFICVRVLAIDMGIDYRFFTYGLLGVIAAFILCYASLMTKMKRRFAKILAKQADHNYANSGLGDEQAKLYTNQICNYFDQSQCFLRLDFSLEILSRELQISRHHLSEIFNIHIGKSFYGFTAEYRITYAIERLREEAGKLKIESLAHECGFNSKTSFNRYFKDITGSNPSEYIGKKVLVQQETAEFATS